MKATWVVISVAVTFVSGCARGDWIDRTLVTETVAGAWEGGHDDCDRVTIGPQ